MAGDDISFALLALLVPIWWIAVSLAGIRRAVEKPMTTINMGPGTAIEMPGRTLVRDPLPVRAAGQEERG